MLTTAARRLRGRAALGRGVARLFPREQGWSASGATASCPVAPAAAAQIAVTKQIETQHGVKDRQPRKRDEPRSGAKIYEGLFDHPAPARRGRRHTEA